MHHCFQNAILKDGTKRDRAKYFPLFERLAEETGIADYASCRERAARGLLTLNRFYKKAKGLLPA